MTTTPTPDQPEAEPLTSEEWATLHDLARRVSLTDPDAWPDTVDAARFLARTARDYAPGGRYYPHTTRTAWADSRPPLEK